MSRLRLYFQKGCFRARALARRFLSILRKAFWNLQGMAVGANTILPALEVTWPHQVAIGANCQLEHGIYFKFDGIWLPGPSIIIEERCFIGAGCEFNIRQRIRIGGGSMIASGCKFIDHDHGTEGQHFDDSPGQEAAIDLAGTVWLGANVVVLKGVVIGDGAVIGAGSIVTKTVPPYETWAGVPAKKIGIRKSAASATPLPNPAAC